MSGGITTQVAAALTAATAVAVQTGPVILGIPAGVLLAACAGALFGLAYTKPETWARLVALPAGSPLERGLWLTARCAGLVFTLLGAALACGWAVSTLPHVPFFNWTAGIPPVPFAGLLAFGAQRLIPAALNAAAKRIETRGAAK